MKNYEALNFMVGDIATPLDQSLESIVKGVNVSILACVAIQLIIIIASYVVRFSLHNS